MARPALDPSIVGQVLDDRYEVLELIGAGGVGMVYRAQRVKLDRIVAIKVLLETHLKDDGFVRRFQLETRAMSRLYHPHCVAVTDFGVYQSRPYIVMEYVPGQTVTRLLQSGPFAPERAVNIALQLLEALTYFHSHHVIHRDLKSENVMLVESSGSADFVKVLDFGMAKILEGPGADSQLSKLGVLPGTPSAMAPEQIHQLPPDPRIDIYATGILLYEMVVGRRPLRGADMATTIKMQMTMRPTPPREILGEAALSLELEQVIMKALEKDRYDRYSSADEMAKALRYTPEGRASRALAPAVHAAPYAEPPPLPTPPPVPARRRRWLPAATLGMAVGAGALITALVGGKASPPPSPSASGASASSSPSASLSAPASPGPTGSPPVAPPPAPLAEPWLAHRDLAATYTGRGKHDDAFREVKAAVADNPTAAAADPSLVDAAVAALARDRVTFVVASFRSNPKLTDALAKVTATGATPDLRHAAHEALRGLNEESRADLIAMRILDVEQAPSCSPMRAAFKKLRGSKDPRVQKLIDDLRARGRKDKHVKCLGRAVRSR